MVGVTLECRLPPVTLVHIGRARFLTHPRAKEREGSDGGMEGRKEATGLMPVLVKPVVDVFCDITPRLSLPVFCERHV